MRLFALRYKWFFKDNLIDDNFNISARKKMRDLI